MSKLTLYGHPGFGSACVEAALDLAGEPYDFITIDSLGTEAERAELARINPAGQVPALRLVDGRLMTESAAILIWIGDRHDGLAPAPGTPERADYLRWMVFLSSAIYSTYVISDGPGRFHPVPDTHETLKAGAMDRRKAMWALMEAAVEPAPYVLGRSMSLLDVYMAMMSRWSPGRSWFDANCPKLAAAASRAEENPVVKAVWERNFR